ncbi:MlaD family protein [Cardinium endosymbiont of Tipula unca]|uniref:MlaD family protein n=1 Tax=Cardinium endosymbiont of Tipula unca TaxID=3066216 RepID=UPI0030D6108F
MYYGFWFLKGRNIFSKYNNYCVSYSVNRNLPVSAPVKLKGHVIGMITKVEILPKKNYSTLITIEVDKQFPLTDQSKVMLSNAGMMEGNVLEIELHDGKPLTGHDIIIGQIHPNFNEDIDLKAMTAQISVIANNLIKTTESVNIILENLQQTSNIIAATVNTFQDDVTTIIKNIINISTPLADPLEGIPGMLPPMHRILSEIEAVPFKDVSSRITHVLSNVEDLLQGASSNNGTLGLLINDKTLYNNLNASVKNLDTLLVDLRKRPSRYVHFSLFGFSRNEKGLKKR